MCHFVFGREDLTSTCTNSLEANNQTVLSWRFSGFCTDIISGINLDVMYGESGKANGVPTKEIIGAYVRWVFRAIPLKCVRAIPIKWMWGVEKGKKDHYLWWPLATIDYLYPVLCCGCTTAVCLTFTSKSACFCI